MTSMTMELAGPHAVVARSLEKRYGRKRALAGVDLTVPEGAVYVLVGPNAAGKTTTLEILLDLVVADAGTAEVFGIDSHGDAARARAQVGWVAETANVAYGWIPVGKLIRYHARFYPSWDDDYAAELARLFDIDPEARFGRLSKGEQRRIQLVLALAHHPPLLLMDEPTDGLDPVMRERTLSALAGHIARFPTTILMSTHRVAEVERLADHLGVMRDGRIDNQLDRETLRRCLRAYHLQVPDDWPGAPALARAVVTRNGSPRERTWTIFGDEPQVARQLRDAGATVREVEPLSLERATLALLSRKEPP